MRRIMGQTYRSSAKCNLMDIMNELPQQPLPDTLKGISVAGGEELTAGMPRGIVQQTLASESRVSVLSTGI